MSFKFTGQLEHNTILKWLASVQPDPCFGRAEGFGKLGDVRLDIMQNLKQTSLRDFTSFEQM